jgi:hypothetical protein
MGPVLQNIFSLQLTLKSIKLECFFLYKPQLRQQDYKTERDLIRQGLLSKIADSAIHSWKKETL